MSSKATYEFKGDTYNLIKEEEICGVKLYPHQRISIHEMEKIESTKLIKASGSIFKTSTQTAIFGDHPGYGKTYSICSVIKRNKLVYKPEQVVCYNNTSSMTTLGTLYEDSNVIKTTVLVLPLGIVKQWKDALDKFDINYLVVNKKAASKADVKEYDVVIVTSTMYKHFYDYNTDKPIVFKRLIFDEPDSTYVAKFQPLESLFRWFVTGTPYRIASVYDRKNPCNQICGWLRSFGLSQNIEHFVFANRLNLIEESIKLPAIVERKHRFAYTRMQSLAMRHVGRDVADAIRNGDMNDAATLMGWNGEHVDITTCITMKYKNRIAELEYEIRGVKLRKERQIQMGHNTQSYTFYDDRIQHLKCRILSIQDCIKEVEKEREEIINAECSICIEKCELPVMTKCCNSVSCRDCLMSWFSQSPRQNCHMCRKVLTKDSIINLTDEKEGDKKEGDKKEGDKKEGDEKEEDEIVSKQATILRLLQRGDENSRWIIFATSMWSFNSLNDSILTSPTVQSLGSEQLKGSTTAIMNTLKRFKDGTTKILLVNNDHNCAGINIIEATDVIIHDSTSTDQELQCIKRAHRMGRTEPLTVHKFVEN